MSNSSAIIEKMLNTIATTKQAANLWIPADHGAGWPTYYGQSTDPTYSMTCSWDIPGSVCSVESYPGHAPAGSLVQGNDPNNVNADRHLTFIDQLTNREYDLWGVSTSPLPSGGGTIKTTWSGYTMAMTGDGRAIGNGGGNAANVGNLAGRIRVEELNDAIANHTYVNHAISIAVDCTNNQSVYPARTGNAGRACHALAGMTDTNAPPMGARIFLNMTFAQINALPVPEWKRVFLRTLSKYGAIINDTGSSFYFSWQTESGNQYTSMGVSDAWLAFATNMRAQQADWNVDGSGNYTGLWQNSNDGLDWTSAVWSHLQVLDPCISDGTCNP
jgi:hypothetical protein